jgi:hypothetical protein
MPTQGDADSALEMKALEMKALEMKALEMKGSFSGRRNIILQDHIQGHSIRQGHNMPSIRSFRRIPPTGQEKSNRPIPSPLL